MNKNSIVIWGAGRIGRGFVGDLFAESNYHLVFVDSSEALVGQLVRQGAYHVVRAKNESAVERIKIDDYDAYHFGQTEQIEEAVRNTGLIAMAVYPHNFEEAAADLQKLILARRAARPDAPVNIILCTNLVHAGPKFTAYLYQGLSPEETAYFSEKVGVVESLVIRIAPDAPQDEVEKDPLVVWTNGYGELPVDAAAFRGEIPEVNAFRLVSDMRAEEMRKIYTYNMCHAVLSYYGHQLGYHLLVECLADPWLRKEAEGALAEVSAALQCEYGFTKAQMDAWIQSVLEHTNNPTVGDTVIRSAADPLRKLRREDRLVGPALLCLKNSVEPHHLVRAIGMAFHYTEDGDAASKKLAELVAQNGLETAVYEVCGLVKGSGEDYLVSQIRKAYDETPMEIEWHQKALEAYRLGFEYEKKYHGCGQSAIAAVTEALDMFDPEVFNAATGLCGGVGLLNDGTCSAFTAGVMAIGLVFPRRRENFNGDRENKYTNFDLVQQLHGKFMEEYGTITCGQIHQKKYGRPYDLSSKEEREAFEEVGGHGNAGCTTVVGKAAQFTVELLAAKMIELERGN